jgi:predicted deacylase
MRLLSLARQSQAIYAVRRGWFEPAHRLGALVAAGDVAGWMHDLERLDAPEEELCFAAGGGVLSHRLHAMCEAGDCLIHVAEALA